MIKNNNNKILFSFWSLLCLISIWAQPCLLNILRLKDQLFFWSFSFFLLLQWIQQSEQQWCWFVYQWWGKTRYWNNLSFHPSNNLSWNSIKCYKLFHELITVWIAITILMSWNRAFVQGFWNVMRGHPKPVT